MSAAPTRRKKITINIDADALERADALRRRVPGRIPGQALILRRALAIGLEHLAETSGVDLGRALLGPQGAGPQVVA